MLNNFSEAFIEIITDGGRPALSIFGFSVYFYAIIIVTGIAAAILLSGILFKKRGIDPYDITEYALVAIPFGVLGARLYVFVFPWADNVMDWSQFFNLRTGGLGIYGGIVIGYLAAFVLCKIKKQDWSMVIDCMMGNVLLAQSIGRWGNFVNGEAYGQLVTNEALQWFPLSVQIGENWYQATFFYESFFTLLGFLICFFVLFRSKHYRKGWISSFYGLYYGIVRLVIEGMRSDSLYIYLGGVKSNIKISQLVSVIIIILAVWRLSRIYRKQLHSVYSKLFTCEKKEVTYSTVYLSLLCIGLFTASVLLFRSAYPLTADVALEFICGIAATLVLIYCVLGVFSLLDRQKLYCAKCGKRLTIDDKGNYACACGYAGKVKLNAFLLKVFPFKRYPDLSVEGIQPYVEVAKPKKEKKND